MRQAGLPARDTRMNDPFKRPPSSWIMEDDLSQGTTIDAAIGIQHASAEGLDDLPPSRLADLDDCPCQFIGIDQDSPAALEHPGDGTFPRRDSAGQTHENHRGAAYIRLSKTSVSFHPSYERRIFG